MFTITTHTCLILFPICFDIPPKYHFIEKMFSLTTDECFQKLKMTLDNLLPFPPAIIFMKMSHHKHGTRPIVFSHANCMTNAFQKKIRRPIVYTLFNFAILYNFYHIIYFCHII